jgi:hypothetical protein
MITKATQIPMQSQSDKFKKTALELECYPDET